MIEKKLVPMTAEEEKRAYAKYYKTQLAQPNMDQMAKLSAGPMDPKKALLPENIKELLNPGYMEVETGYCNLENGAGYLAVNNKFPNCTLDMIKWWFAWHTLEGLRYKIWNPFCHQTIAVSDEDRKKITDPNIPVDQKIEDVVHFVVENIGAGFQDIVIHFLKREVLGFSEEELSNAKATIIGGYGLAENREGAQGKVPTIMAHYYRETEEGIESRTRFWMGYRFNKGIPMCVLPKGVVVPIEAPMGLAFHNVEEFSHLASILPDLYKEFGHLPIQ